METQKVGVREFRDNLATYLVSDRPVAITRHGDTLGLFIPTRPKRTEAQRQAFRELSDRWQATLDAAGISEDEVVEEFERLRARERLHG